MGIVISFSEAKESHERIDASSNKTLRSKPIVGARVIDLHSSDSDGVLRDQIDNDDALAIGSSAYKQAIRDRQIALARDLVTRAALILSPLGECENRVSWILEDCLDMLNEGEWNKTQDSESRELKPPTFKPLNFGKTKQSGMDHIEERLVADGAYVLTDGTNQERFCAWPRLAN